MKFGIALIITGTLLGSSVYSQTLVEYPSYWNNYLIKNFTLQNNSLPSEAVYAAHQSADGFLWIVCSGGLVRYDGISMKIFHTGNTNYQGSTLYEIHEDSKGNLWLPTIGEGIMKFENNDFIHFRKNTGLVDEMVKSMAIAENDTLWLGTYGSGIQAFAGDTFLTNYTQKDGLVNDQVWSMIVDDKNRLWIGTNGGLSIFENGMFKNFTTENGLPYNVIRGLTQMDNGDVWVGTDRDGIVVFREDKPVQYFNSTNGLNGSYPQYFAQDPLDGSIWIAHHGNGIDRYDKNKFDALTRDDGLVSDLAAFIYFSKEGLALVGSESGLSIIQRRRIDVVNSSQGLTADLLVNVNQDSSGIIWVGTDGSGFNFKKGGKWQSLEYPPQFTNGYASGATVDPAGNIWFNTKGTGIVRIQDYEAVKLFNQDSGLISGFIRAIAFDKQGRAWVGTNDGVQIIQNDEIIATYTTANGLPNNFITASHTANDGSIWMGTFGGGAIRFSNGEFAVFDTSSGLISNKVFVFAEDHKKNLWLSGSTGGLSMHDGKTFKSLDRTDGLPSDGFNALIEDDFGDLWLANGGGIFKTKIQDLYDRLEGKIDRVPFTHYSLEDGFPSSTLEIAYNSTATKTKNGEILFATNDGIAVVKPEKLAEPAPDIITYIDELLLDGESINIEDEIIFKPGQNKIEIMYSAFNFQSPSKTHFRVKLDGIDANWVPMGNRRTVYYDFLPDGNYTFHVAATNADGKWNYHSTSLAFKVLPPFYKTWWFILAVFLLFGTLVATYVRIRYAYKMRELNRKLALQHQIQKERERISRDLHDNVGAHITNLITGLEISNLHINKNQKDEAVSLLKNLDLDARGAMTELRETIWLLDQKKVLISEFEKHIKGFLKRQQLYSNGLEISFENYVNENLELNPSQSLHLIRIIQEAFTNCRKYAEATTFKITICNDDELIKVHIADDGIGMVFDEINYNGNGLKNMQRRAKDLNGSLFIDGISGEGTKVSLEFPIIP